MAYGKWTGGCMFCGWLKYSHPWLLDASIRYVVCQGMVLKGQFVYVQNILYKFERRKAIATVAVKIVNIKYQSSGTASKIQNSHQGAPKWPTGSRKGSHPRLLGAIINNFHKIGFVIRALYEIRWQRRKKRGVGKKITLETVTINVIASRLPNGYQL